MSFAFSSGSRPLDGYTLKRGIGRGGFGEVYYAVSDGGKEVALKLVTQNLDVELRGISQCLNLKHPNLLALYDIKTDAEGRRWVAMEYIAGEALNAVIQRHPRGLPADLARQWFSGLAQAVHFLHEHGIVHRDLKPANIFLENGVLKVGDYGLSKFMTGSQHDAQTQSVGTVHYMAPEVSTGNYSKQIDVYAAGVILFEMLTGRVPFDGESAGEILMKHLTALPDLTGLPPGYAPVVGKALAKDPAHRYPTMSEMLRAVEACGDRRTPHGAARPDAVPAEPVCYNLKDERPAGREAILDALPVGPADRPSARRAVAAVASQVGEVCGSMVLTALFALVGCALFAALARGRDLTDLGTAYFLMVVTSWAVLVPAKFLVTHADSAWVGRVVMLVLGLLIGAGAFWLDGGPVGVPAAFAADPFRHADPAGDPYPDVTTGWAALPGYISYFGLGLCALSWWKMADRRRPQRFSVWPVCAAGFWAAVLQVVWPDPWRGLLVLAGSAVIVQLVSPWQAPPPAAPRKVRLRYA